MTITTLAILLPLVAVAAAYPFYPCNCGLGAGEDVCHQERCSPLVVRPMEIPKPILPAPKVVCAPVGGIPPLVPVGSPCQCHTSFVKPAQVPKPLCTACAGRVDITNDQLLTLSQKQQLLFGGAHKCSRANKLGELNTVPLLIDETDRVSLNPANYVPADPVSLHVAYKLAQESCDHNEDKLAFGFRSIPKEIPLYIRRAGNQVPEENLLSLNGQIVELKAKKCTKTKSLAEEAKELLVQLAEEEAEENLNAAIENSIKHVSLGEIGYGPANIKEPAFVNVESTGIPTDGLIGPIKDCNDGFKPGDVTIKQIPKHEHLSLPPVLPEPCPPEDEPYIPPPPAIPPGTLFTSPYTYFSSSSSSDASSANSYKKSVFLQKLGCS